MPDFGTMLPFKQLQRWSPGCWCAALICLHDPCEVKRVDAGPSLPEQWAFFLWSPRDEAKPFALPCAWGVTGPPAYVRIYDKVGSAPILFLQDKDIDMVAVLEWLQALDTPPAWLAAAVAGRLDSAKAAKRRELRKLFNAPEEMAFRRFLRQVLATGA